MLILVKSTGGATQVQLIEGIPDFSQLPEPTKSILQASFDAGDYTIVEEAEFIESEQPPDWDSFMMEMDARGLFMVGLTANFAVFTQIFNMLLSMRDKRSLPNDECVEWRNFRLMYGLGRAAFSESQLSEVEAAMSLANIPLIL